MLTPEQQKLFRFLRLIGKSSGRDFLEIDLEDEVLRDTPFEVDELSNVGGWRNPLELPQKAAEEFTQFVNENVLPKMVEAYNNLEDTYGFDEISRMRTEIFINLDKKFFQASLHIEWYGEEEATSEVHDLPQDVIDEIQADFPNDEVVQARIDYSGGGDSGQVEDSMSVKLASGRNVMESISPKTLEFAYNILPGGWEINEGSYGNISLDLDEKLADVNHTWNSYNSESETILEFDF